MTREKLSLVLTVSADSRAAGNPDGLFLRILLQSTPSIPVHKSRLKSVPTNVDLMTSRSRDAKGCLHDD